MKHVVTHAQLYSLRQQQAAASGRKARTERAAGDAPLPAVRIDKDRISLVQLAFMGQEPTDPARWIDQNLEGESKMSGFMPEVQTAGDGDHWSTNHLVFATQEEAQAYVDDLEFRWTAVRATRVVWSNKPVNSRWDGERRQRVESGPDAVA